MFVRGCVCDAVRNLPSNVTHIAIVRHVLEVKKLSNTGRFAAALPNSSLHTFGNKTAPLDGTRLCRSGAWVLFPEGPAPVRPPQPPPRSLIVLDGTWHQARRMRQRIEALRGLPVLSLPPPSQPRSRMRRAPNDTAMSTLEAVAAALDWLGEREVAEHLDAIHDAVIAAAALAGRRQMPRS